LLPISAFNSKLSICDDSKVLLVAHRNKQIDGSLYYADCTPQILENTILQMQRKYKLPVRSLRTDRDSVYMSKKFQDFLTKEGIEHQPSSGYSPQKNGHAERAIRTLTEARDALLADSGLANKFWGDVLMHATYVKNLCSSSSDLSPFELFRGFKPDVMNLRVFGCACYVRIPSEHCKKGAVPHQSTAGQISRLCSAELQGLSCPSANWQSGDFS
jgi:hypothetical protein